MDYVMKPKTTVIQTMPCQLYNLYDDMIKQTHLLIAGTTGSGKSTVINALIQTAICKDPFTKLILLDSKGIELCDYIGMFQCLKYASSIHEQYSALNYCYNVMAARFKDMRKQGIKKTDKSPIYLIIDEYADIATSQYKKDCLRLIQRICQLSRAVNIHVIIGTQTPISKILSTEIKVNLDSRLGLRTRSKQDSRNIIDKTGLETLPRYGYGYYMTPEKQGIVKLPMYTEEEYKQFLAWYKDKKHYITKRH